MSLISVRNVRKVYQVENEKIVALNRINLEIGKGEVCCILGTSGSGKSTLLNMMAGLEKASKGQIIIANEDVTSYNEQQWALFRQKHIGFVFQSYNLMPTQTAIENVAMPLVFQGTGKSKRVKESVKMLKAVGLGTRLSHKPTQMSGGQQQRVGIARAFVGKPGIIFADEPTGNLDSKTSREVMNIMVDMAHKYGLTLIIVTHDISIARFADRIIELHDGLIRSDAPNDPTAAIEGDDEQIAYIDSNADSAPVDVTPPPSAGQISGENSQCKERDDH